MAAKSSGRGAKFTPIDLNNHVNWPRRTPGGEWLKTVAQRVANFPTGSQTSWGVPFAMAAGKGPRVVLLDAAAEVAITLKGTATHVCLLHTWEQRPDTARPDEPREGMVVAEYEIGYADGSAHVQPIRARFEVAMAGEESPGPPWLAVPFDMPQSIDPGGTVPDRTTWSRMQMGLDTGRTLPLLYALPNPHPGKRLGTITLRSLSESPLLIAGITLYRGVEHPCKHLPRRTYRVRDAEGRARVDKADIDLGTITRTIPAYPRRGKRWLEQPGTPEKQGGENLLQIVGAEDATVRAGPRRFNLGEAFHHGKSSSGTASLEVLGRRRQWMQIRVVDSTTGRPTPTRAHFSGTNGEYIAPYGHHEQVNTNWFEDYGADVQWWGRNYAYVPGEFTTDMPVGEVYVELCKGFEYRPVRAKVTIRPGQKDLELRIKRWKDLRSTGWVTADTHVHFISPHTAWLEGQAEGINVVNLLASQWGRLFTNVGDITGRVGVVEDDTIVYVGTENRNHMLGHMSMLGTQGLPVYPMCCGGPGESWIGDPDFMLLADWARENKAKGGVVIRPHYPFCGHTEDPVPIIKELVDALEINVTRQNGFPVQEWYRYLNCGYRVAVAGGTDKMGAYCPVGWMRTYAKVDPSRPFDYDAWAEAVRAGRTTTTSGPLIDLWVDGREIGDTITMGPDGGTVEVQAVADSVWPIESLEIVHDGTVVASQITRGGAEHLSLKKRVRITGSGWIAARCSATAHDPDKAAHTSPIYVTCGDTRAFDGPAAQHMLALVEGGMEYLNTLATVFDEASRKRMVRQFKEVQGELKGRLLVEAHGSHSHGGGGHHH